MNQVQEGVLRIKLGKSHYSQIQGEARDQKLVTTQTSGR